jgi:hypothetical protein
MTTPIEIYREMVYRSNPWIFDCAAHSAVSYNKEWRETGKKPPEWYLPGGLIKSLTPEQREILSKLTSEEVMKERYPF